MGKVNLTKNLPNENQTEEILSEEILPNEISAEENFSEENQIEENLTGKIFCPKCGAEIQDEDAKFCPKCGAEIFSEKESWFCKNCGDENFGDALFCKTCGKSRDEQKKFIHSDNFKFIMALIFVVLIGGFGSYFYFNNMNEENYLTNYAAASRELVETNEIMESNIKAATLRTANVTELNGKLQKQKNSVDEQANIFSQMKPFKNYEKQHNDVLSLLKKESTLIDQAVHLISNPLDNSAESTLENMRANISAINSLNSQIQVPNATFVSSVNLSNVADQLNIFVTEQKKINKEKMDKLAANKEFFRQMDDAINRYQSARNELDKMLESTRKSDMTWADYFSMLDKAKTSREGVRYTVKDIKTVPGTEDLKRSFMDVLDDSIRYCEMMRAAANLGFNNYNFNRLQKERESKTLNDQIQQEFDSFIDGYNSAKNRMTNMNNL